MSDITVKFKSNDREIKDALNNEFGDNVDFFESKGFDGSEFIFVAVIPIAALTFQVIDFFLNHFSSKKNSGRIIIKEGKDVIIEGYNFDEVEDFLKSLLDNDNE